MLLHVFYLTYPNSSFKLIPIVLLNSLKPVENIYFIVALTHFLMSFAPVLMSFFLVCTQPAVLTRRRIYLVPVKRRPRKRDYFASSSTNIS